MFYWVEELYSYTKIYDSLSPITRLCVDLRIQGRKPAYIAITLRKSLNTVKKALYRAKKRYLNAYLSQKQPIFEKGDISNSRDPNSYDSI